MLPPFHSPPWKQESRLRTPMAIHCAARLGVQAHKLARQRPQCLLHIPALDQSPPNNLGKFRGASLHHQAFGDEMRGAPEVSTMTTHAVQFREQFALVVNMGNSIFHGFLRRALFCAPAFRKQQRETLESNPQRHRFSSFVRSRKSGPGAAPVMNNVLFVRAPVTICAGRHWDPQNGDYKHNGTEQQQASSNVSVGCGE